MDLPTRDRAPADVAPLSARQPGVPRPGAERGAPLRRPGLIRAPGPVAQAGLAAVLLAGLLATGLGLAHPPLRLVIHAMPDTARAAVAAIVLFAVTGLGIVRLWLPNGLRAREPLWILPAGACALGLAMTVLGFAAVPFPVSLAACAGGAIVLDAVAVRRHGWPELELRRIAWPALLAFVVACAALIPIVFEQHYLAVTGTGSDAHVAAGTGEFLRHAAPLDIRPGLPIDRMPPLWASKFPIYYALGAVSTVSGLATWQVLPVLAALLLGLTASGLFLVARDLFGASATVATVAMALAGLDRMALHTVLNPYFNQTWGYFALPFTLVLGWWVVQPGLDEPARRRCLLLLAGFGLVLLFAYPLAAPIPAVPLLVFLRSERRRRIAAGERVWRLRDLYRGRRSLFVLVPLGFLLLIPFAAVLGKAVGAAAVLAPGHSLLAWGGDLRSFIPFDYFLGLPNTGLGSLLALAVLWFAWRGLRDAPRPLARGLGGLLVAALLLAAYLRHREYGYYFHFKLLAFCGPLIVLVAVIGASRVRRRVRLTAATVVLLAVCVGGQAIAELRATGFQLSTAEIGLRDWAAALPAGASVRLDMVPGTQLWTAYMMAARPLCSQTPLTGTDYPHVPVSRRARYILLELPPGATAGSVAPPRDAVGGAVRVNQQFALYRESPAVPGVDHCSLRRVSRLFDAPDHSRT